MSKTGVAAALLVVVALSGCSAATAESDKAAQSQSRIAAEQPVEASGAIEDAEAVYLRTTRATMHGIEGLTDAELIELGDRACGQLREGIAIEDVAVMPGPAAGEPVVGWNDENLAGLAAQTYCVEFNPVAY